MMTARQIRQLDRLLDDLNNDPHLTREDKRKILHDFASGFNPPSSIEEINDYLNFHFGTAKEEALAHHRAAAAFMAGQPPS